MLRLDIAHLERLGYLSGLPMRLSWSSGNGQVGCLVVLALASGLKLMYRTRTGEDDWRYVVELLPFTWTPMRLGGARRWFQCPSCGRRCRVLLAGWRFRCRHCHLVRYSSQSETRADRAIRGMLKIVKRLDPKEQRNDLPWKPKRMHWRTYIRLAERHAQYGSQWASEVVRRFGAKL